MLFASDVVEGINSTTVQSVVDGVLNTLLVKLVVSLKVLSKVVAPFTSYLIST